MMLMATVTVMKVSPHRPLIIYIAANSRRPAYCAPPFTIFRSGTRATGSAPEA